MNKIFLIGNLTRDCETRTTDKGTTVCTFTIAVGRKFKQEGKPDADFFRVSVFGKMGDACAKYLSKGKKVAVSGDLTINNYTNKEGQQRTSVDVSASEVEFLTPRSDSAPAIPTDMSGFTDVNDDSLPF